jgi:tetratricopeptide (TPR) repeat protein
LATLNSCAYCDPGLLHVDPVPIDADHIDICKPADDGDLVYAGTRDFIIDEIVSGEASAADCGSLRRFDLPPLPRSRSRPLAPIAVRLAVLAIIGLIAFKGVQALLFPPDLLSAASIEEITATLRVKSPRLTATQIDQFIQSLRELRGDPSFGQAVEEAKNGNTRVAEGILRQIYENRIKEKQKSEKEAAEAARNLAAITVVNNVADGLKWYREATALDPNNMAGWLGLGDAAVDAGILPEAGQAFLRNIVLARRARDEREVSVGLTWYGDVLMAQGNLPEALKSFRDGHDIFDRLAKADPGNAGWQRDLSVSYSKIAGLLRQQGDNAQALDSLKQGRAIIARLTALSPTNATWKSDLAWFDRQIAALAR